MTVYFHCEHVKLSCTVMRFIIELYNFCIILYFQKIVQVETKPRELRRAYGYVLTINEKVSHTSFQRWRSHPSTLLEPEPLSLLVHLSLVLHHGALD